MGTSFPVPQDMASQLAERNQDSAEIILGVRPEHIVLQPDGADGIGCTVEVSELMGSEFYLHATVDQGGQQQGVVMRIQTTDLPAQYRSCVPYGTKLTFSFRDQLIHLFDPESERNLLAY